MPNTQVENDASHIGLVMQGPHVAVVTLLRPEARNAINAPMAQDLEHVVQRLEADDQVRAVVLTGAGDKAFCSGADLREVAAGRLDDLFTTGGGFAGFVNAERRKPWIAAVNGFALAGGCEIALACDMIVAAEDAQFGLPEVTRGLIASAGGLYRLPRALPKAIALEMIATGQPLPAARALTLGLVNMLCSREELLDRALALADTIASNAPLAVAASLKIARSAAVFTDTQLHEQGDREQAALAGTADFREGATAFVEKRAPRWQGH